MAKKTCRQHMKRTYWCRQRIRGFTK